MSIRYDLVRSNFDEEDAPLRAQFVPNGTITTQKLVKWMVQTGGHHPGQIKGIMDTLHDAILDFLEQGYNVQLGELGYLSIALSSRPVKSKKEIRSESVHFKKLNFRTGTQVRRRLEIADMERVSRPVKRPKKGLSQEDCAKKLKEFLSEYPCINRRDYSQLTGRFKDNALKDLHAFMQEGWLMKYGSGKGVVYILRSSLHLLHLHQFPSAEHYGDEF